MRILKAPPCSSTQKSGEARDAKGGRAGDSAGINLRWLEKGFTAAGFYLQDWPHGRNFESLESGLQSDDPAVQKPYTGTLLRDAGANVSISQRWRQLARGLK